MDCQVGSADSRNRPNRTSNQGKPQNERADLYRITKLFFDYGGAGTEISHSAMNGRTSGDCRPQQVEPRAIHQAKSIADREGLPRGSVGRAHYPDANDHLTRRRAKARFQQPEINEQDHHIQRFGYQEGREAKPEFRSIRDTPPHKHPGIDDCKGAEQKGAIKNEGEKAVAQSSYLIWGLVELILLLARLWLFGSGIRSHFENVAILENARLFQQILCGWNATATRPASLGVQRGFLVTVWTFHKGWKYAAEFSNDGAGWRGLQRHERTASKGRCPDGQSSYCWPI